MMNNRTSIVKHGNLIILPVAGRSEDVAADPFALGVFAQRHLEYIEKNEPDFYRQLEEENNLIGYLEFVDWQANDLLNWLVNYAVQQEALEEPTLLSHRAAYQRRMEEIRRQAEEEVNRELIYC